MMTASTPSRQMRLAYWIVRSAAVSTCQEPNLEACLVELNAVFAFLSGRDWKRFLGVLDLCSSRNYHSLPKAP